MGIISVEHVGDVTLDRVSKLLGNIPGGVQRASYQALKRAGEAGKTNAGQFASSQYSITKSTFMANVHQKTTISGGGGNVDMRLSFSGTVIPLIKFKSTASRGGLVTTQVTRNGGAASLQHAFVATIYGERGIWERLGRPRFPVRQFYGPSAAHMMENEAVTKQMDDVIASTYERRMEQEILRLMNGW